MPDYMRRSWWIILTRKTNDDVCLDRILPHRPNIVPFLESTGLDGEILRDLPRTFPNEPLFQSTDGQVWLANVLKGIAIHLPDVGYCQGMNYIAAKLLLLWHKTSVHVEQDVFSVLCGICREHNLLWSPGMTGLRRCIFALHKLMQRHLPALYAHLRRIGIHEGYFATQWFITLFTRILPDDATFAMVWDHFLVDGFKMLYRIALVLLECMQQDLLEMEDMEQATMYFSRNPKAHLLHGKQDNLIEHARRFKITRSMLASLEEERQVQLLHFRMRSSHSDHEEDAIFYPEGDAPVARADLDRIRAEVESMEANVAADVCVFRRKIERIVRAADAASQAYLQATARMSEAAYRLDDVLEWQPKGKPQENRSWGPLNRLWACLPSQNRRRRHVHLADDDDDDVHGAEKAAAVAQLDAARFKVIEAQLNMEELSTLKVKMMQQCVQIVNLSERDKTHRLQSLFDALDNSLH
ncbi:hypothetical protein LEN26_015872 [Aphanomyces euteiches]|nr:hypothetical protein LEN26_015872 [Aphanomyces euteiches]KAH9102458.1 hypothetical protein AeMF1_020911 [Aphanomyces euteiches]KAH9188650.1 hypothetical protein AeNC1_009373 [Aphanomyces euteiches]